MTEREEKLETEDIGRRKNNFKEEMPQSLMPRERLIKNGAGAVSKAELIAILLRTGTQGMDVLEMSKKILKEYDDSLAKIANTPVRSLIKQIKGLGETKAVTLIAALELGRKMVEEETTKKIKLNDANSASGYFASKIGHLEHEEFWVAVFNNNNQLIHSECISQGGWTSTSVDVRKVMSIVLENKGTSIIVAHNHPSGTCEPSRQDREITRRLMDAAKVLDLRLMDHIIVARGNGYYSFCDNNDLF